MTAILALDYYPDAMNFANSTNTSKELVNVQNLSKSLSLLQAAVAPNSTFILYGIVAVISNTLTILTIWKTKRLHSKCFVTLAINAFIDLALGAVYGVSGLIRVHRYYSGAGDVHTLWSCFGEVSLNIYIQLAALGMAPALVIERLMAAFAPHTYKNTSYRRLTIPTVILVNLFALAQFIVHLHDSYVDGSKVLYTCGVPDTTTASSAQALTVVQVGTSALVVALNMFLIHGIKKQSNNVKSIIINVRGQPDASQQQQQPPAVVSDRDRRCYKAILLISLLHIICHLGGRLVIFVATSSVTSDTAKAAVNRWGRTLIVANAAMHFFVLYFTSNQFREGVKILLRRVKVRESTVIVSSVPPPAFKIRPPAASMYYNG